MDPSARQRHRIRNVAQALLLLGGMAVVLGGASWVLFGPAGPVWVLGLAAFALALRPRVPPRWILSMYGAVPLPARAAPEVHRFVRVLAERAGLPRVPDLFYVRSSMLNAMAVGDREDAAICLTDGLLRRLTARELAGVLAHEVSHVRANDLWIMSLSDVVARLAQVLSYVGMFALVLTLPLTAEGIYWPFIAAAAIASLPTVVTLLQLALSRSREYDADLEAAALTDDPVGLASALRALEHQEGRIWERMVVPHRRVPDPLLLRTHPPTEERVRRLLSLVPRQERDRLGGDEPRPPNGYTPAQRPPRLRPPGVWW